MSMHLHHPSLSLNGKRKGKTKFRNADEARKSRELDAEWKALKSKWGVDEDQRRQRRAMAAETLSYSLGAPAGRATTKHIPSLNTGAAVAAAAPAKVYTGTKMLGIGTMHKSNSVPIFSNEEAVAIATMRRN